MKKFLKAILLLYVFTCAFFNFRQFGFAMTLDLTNYQAGTVINPTDNDTASLTNSFSSSTITAGDAVYNRIYGKSYIDNSDIAISDLRYLKMLHYNFDGNIQVGEMIVNKSIADSTLAVFKALFNAKYQIRQMHLVDDFWYIDSSSTDDVCMLVDNTSCFNYRAVQGTSKISKHALGLAIDINPHENPYAKVLSDGSLSMFKPELYADGYLTSRSSKIHAITTSDTAYKLFISAGFSWGGNWNSVKDFQHFEK